MFKRILVVLTGCESDAVALETAYLFGRLFDAHLHCICPRPGPGQIALGGSPFEIGGAINAAELIADLQKENGLCIENARRAYEVFRDKRHIIAEPRPNAGVTATWREMSGDEVETTITESRFHDLVVLARPSQPTALSTAGIGAILVGSGRPLLLA